MLKRYALFAGDCYYPQGGFDDLIDTADSIEELSPSPSFGKPFTASNGGIYRTVKFAYRDKVFEWYQIVGLTTGEQMRTDVYSQECLQQQPSQPTEAMRTIESKPQDGVPIYDHSVGATTVVGGGK